MRLADTEILRDSLDWENNPLFGWCEKNTKKDGTKYNLYNARAENLCTTLDSRMQQQYAEDAVDRASEGTARLLLQGKKGAKKAPSHTFRLTQRAGGRDSGTCHEIYCPIATAPMKKAGATEEIRKPSTPRRRCPYSLGREKDTIMTPDGFHPLLQVLPSCWFHVHGPRMDMSRHT